MIARQYDWKRSKIFIEIVAQRSNDSTRQFRMGDIFEPYFTAYVKPAQRYERYHQANISLSAHKLLLEANGKIVTARNAKKYRRRNTARNDHQITVQSNDTKALVVSDATTLERTLTDRAIGIRY